MLLELNYLQPKYVEGFLFENLYIFGIKQLMGGRK